MNVNFQTNKEDDGTYTVIVTFSDVPSEADAQACGNLIKRELMRQGAVGSTAPIPPFGKTKR